MPTLYEKFKTIQDAINFEIDKHYINAKGKNSTFSNFIIKNTRELSFDLYDKDGLKSLINLFYSYPTQDISMRIETIHKAQSILRDILSKNKSVLNENGEKKETPKKKTQHFEKDLKKTDVKYVKGVGPKMAQVLNRLGVFSVHDLFYHFPRNYIDYQKKSSIKDLKDGEHVTVLGKIKSVSVFDPPKKRHLSVLTITIVDDNSKLVITKFFSRKFKHVLAKQYKKQFPAGAPVACAGKVTFDKYSRAFSLENAIIEALEKEESPSKKRTSKIVPVYPLTEGLNLDTLRKIVTNAFDTYEDLISETLPSKMIKELKLLDLQTSIKEVHFPSSHELCGIARNRLVFEEFFLMQLQLAYRRLFIDKDRKGLNLKKKKNSLIDKLIKSLPFKLTGSQERVYKEIITDLSSEKPMHRLLQGDVGSGKTIVALIALLYAIENGFQVALMAPTEILAHQHATKIQEYLNPLNIQAVELTGSTPAKIKREIYKSLENGEIKIVVGTHALIQEDVKFENLGFVVIDEQHRFGVKQRDELLKKGKSVERLFMTATPIPRTLALALHGDLELSEIDELPPGRIPIKTSVVMPSNRNKAFDLIKGEIAKGRQAYIVFPLIEESEALAAKAAIIEFEELSKTVFKDLKMGLMHGELKSAEKEKVMSEFVENKTNILVSTTVIEVGVDVPNATVMMIENAERFGLSQLHQLRGRIGRGGEQAYCLLVPQNYSEDSSKRLQIMTKTTNGFVISQEDLKIRGPGEFLGTRQSGLPELKIGDLVEDAEILEKARNKALEVLKEGHDLKNYPEIKKLLSEKGDAYITAG